MMTNTGKTKAEVILYLVMSLNAGDSYNINQRVDTAIEQYNKLVKRRIIIEEEEQPINNSSVDVGKLFCPPVGPL